MSLPYSSDRTKLSRRKQLLDLSLADEWVTTKREVREMFALLKKQNYSIAGYAARLEQALVFVRRAEAAINALEGR